MHKKLLLVLLISSPLLAVEDVGTRDDAYIPPMEEIGNRRIEREGESRFGEDLECCLFFLPRLAIFGSLAVVVTGGLTFEVVRGAGRLTVGVARGAIEKVKPKTD